MICPICEHEFYKTSMRAFRGHVMFCRLRDLRNVKDEFLNSQKIFEIKQVEKPKSLAQSFDQWQAKKFEI